MEMFQKRMLSTEFIRLNSETFFKLLMMVRFTLTSNNIIMLYCSLACHCRLSVLVHAHYNLLFIALQKINKIACSPDLIYGSCKEGIEISASNVLPILFTLHNRRFISQARRTRHCARSARWGEEKNKAPVTSPLFWLVRPPTQTDGGDVKRTNQNTIHYSNIVIFRATRNTNNSIKHRK